ncbi:unnamed protein product [Menidia menidia]|uniref:(Atlantic silverside) hypothetical protein n=1 Tax=Menidia menidia TaxID=238744 RepID=A0A8S4BDV7_9TELE|nr:unnamed protein product [Menidia menidia]
MVETQDWIVTVPPPARDGSRRPRPSREGGGGPRRAKTPQRQQSPHPPQRKMSRKRQPHRCPPSPEIQKVHQQMGPQKADVRPGQAGQDADSESPK